MIIETYLWRLWFVIRLTNTFNIEGDVAAPPPPPRGGGALRFFFDGGVPQPTMKWGSKERTTMVKYRVLGTTELSGRVKTGSRERMRRVHRVSLHTQYGRVLPGPVSENVKSIST